MLSKEVLEQIEKESCDKSASPSDWSWIRGYMIRGAEIQDASRDSHILSAVPSEEWLTEELEKLDKKGKPESFLQGYSDAYYDIIEQLKKRGIAG